MTGLSLAAMSALRGMFAILAGKDEKCVDKAMKLIKVRYVFLPAVLDYHTALDNPVLVHPEENWSRWHRSGADNKRNLCAHDESGAGDIEAVLAGAMSSSTIHTTPAPASRP